MSYEENLTTITCTAGEDLSTAQYRFVKLTADRQVMEATAVTDEVIGVLQNDPGSGEAAKVAIAGVTKIQAGGTISAGDYLVPNATGGNGQAVKETGPSTSTSLSGMTKVCGQCVEGASANEYGSALILFAIPN